MKHIKKASGILICLCLLFSIAACGRPATLELHATGQEKQSAESACQVVLTVKWSDTDLLTYAIITAIQDKANLSVINHRDGTYTIEAVKDQDIEISLGASNFKTVNDVIKASELKNNVNAVSRTYQMILSERVLSGKLTVKNADDEAIENAAVTISQNGEIVSVRYNQNGEYLFTPDMDIPMNVLIEAAGYASQTFTVANGELLSETYQKSVVMERAAGTENAGRTVASKIESTASGKEYFTVNGKPFLLVGAQIRIDGIMNCDLTQPSQTNAAGADVDALYQNDRFAETLRRYFEKASSLGLTCLEIPMEWGKLEPSEDRYDYRIIDTVMSLAVEFGIKTEILWFGSNMCGMSGSYYTPAYILNDTTTYSQFNSNWRGLFNEMAGFENWLEPDNANLLNRETKAVTALMDHVYSWDIANNAGKKVVVGFQVQNEPDGLANRVTEDANNPDTNKRNLTWSTGSKAGQILSAADAWTAVKTNLNEIGLSVKNSRYCVVTRVNFAGTQALGNADTYAEVQNVYALEGIDMVGDDPYDQSAKKLKEDVIGKLSTLRGNLPHIAENYGKTQEAPSLMLMTTGMGGIYMFYDLATPDYFVNKLQPATDDYGIFHTDLTERTGSNEVKVQALAEIISGLRGAGFQAVTASAEDFAVFNVAGGKPNIKALEQSANTSQITIGYSKPSNDSGIGFAIASDGYIVCFSTGNCSMTFSNGVFGAVEYGVFDSKNIWRKAGDGALTSGKLDLIGGRVYRIPYTYTEELNSTTQDIIGIN